MVSLLAGSVQGMQGSLGSAYQSMANNLKQSMEMTQAMNDMMELFLVSSLNICSRIERDEHTDGSILILTTENTSQFPIPGMTGELRIGRDYDKDRPFELAAQSRARWISSSVTAVENRKEKTISKESALYKQLLPGDTHESQTQANVLLPGMSWTDIFELDMEAFEDWVILVKASFKSPGSGKTLFKKHECCVYLLDQCAIEWLPRNGEDTVPEMVFRSTMLTACLRQVLQVPLTDGVAEGARFVMAPSKGDDLRIHGRIEAISEDKQKTTCSLWPSAIVSDPGVVLEERVLLDAEQKRLTIVDRICRELDVLGQVLE